MLTKKEIETIQQIVFQETGEKISHETAAEWATSIYELLLFIICPPEEFYFRLSVDPDKTILDKMPQ